MATWRVSGGARRGRWLPAAAAAVVTAQHIRGSTPGGRRRSLSATAWPLSWLTERRRRARSGGGSWRVGRRRQRRASRTCWRTGRRLLSRRLAVADRGVDVGSTRTVLCGASTRPRLHGAAGELAATIRSATSCGSGASEVTQSTRCYRTARGCGCTAQRARVAASSASFASVRRPGRGADLRGVTPAAPRRQRVATWSRAAGRFSTIRAGRPHPAGCSRQTFVAGAKPRRRTWQSGDPWESTYIGPLRPAIGSTGGLDVG